MGGGGGDMSSGRRRGDMSSDIHLNAMTVCVCVCVSCDDHMIIL